MKGLFLLIFMSCIFCLSAQVGRARIVDVFLIGGQSNATGQGYVRNIPRSFEVDTTVMFYYSRYLNGGKEVNVGASFVRHQSRTTNSELN